MSAPAPLQPVQSLYRVHEFTVDATWYAAQYPDAVLAVQRGEYKSLALYHASAGEKRLNSPTPLFHSRHYARVSGYEQRKPEWGLVEDYFRWGANKSLSPHWLFSEEFAQHQEPRLRAAMELRSLSGSYIFYLRQGSLRRLRPHPLFCEATLSHAMPGVERNKLFAEYLRNAPADLPPGPLFDASWYAGRYPELKTTVGPGMRCESLLQHFCEFGMEEERTPIPDLDIEYYVRECLKGGILDNVKGFKAVRHFLTYGLAAGLNPNRFFNTQYYVENNPDVASEVKELGLLGPFEHFLAVGMQRKLRASPPLVQLAVDEDSAKALFEKRARLEAAQLTSAGGPLALQSPDRPAISVVVPVFNNFNYTAWLLRQLHDYQLAAPGVKFEVIVVDDGSSDRTRELDKFVSGAKLVRLPGGAGYPGACNAGAKAARGEHVVFVNNDIEILRGTFEAVVRALSDPAIGAAGGRIIKLNGVLQEAGGLVFDDGSAAGYGRGQDPMRAKFMAARDVDYCSGCLLAVRRSVFEKLGGFEEQFAPGYYEDTDLCARIWEAGLRVRYDPAIAINHYEYASFSKGRPETISTALMARNRDLFGARNAAFLAKQPRPEIEQIDTLAFWRNQTNRHVVLVEDFAPAQAIGSGFVRSTDIVDSFLRNGWRVTIWVVHKRPGIEPRDEGLCETLFESDYPGGLDRFLKAAGRSVDLFWVCRTHNFKRVGERIQKWRADLPASEAPRVVFDTEAIASVRTWLVSELASGERIDISDVAGKVPKAMVARELAHAAAADTLVVMNEIDRKLAQSAVALPVAALSHCFVPQPTPARFNERSGLLFCGAIHEAASPNYDSLVWFCNKVLPLLQPRIRDLKVTILGYWKTDVPVPEALRRPGVTLAGSVDDLEPWFGQARVFVAPTRVAAGMPHKVQQSMAYGLPAVVTPILAAQLRDVGAEGEITFTAPDFSAEGFAAQVVRAYTDEAAWGRVREAALQSICEFANPTVFAQTIATISGARAPLDHAAR